MMDQGASDTLKAGVRPDALKAGVRPDALKA